MRTITMADIRKHHPCYDPTKYAGENWSGTVLNILRHPCIPEADKIWLVSKLVSPKTAILFGIACARESLKLITDPDPRLIEACDIAEKYAHNKAYLRDAQKAKLSAANASDENPTYASYAVNDAIDACIGNMYSRNAINAALYAANAAYVSKHDSFARIEARKHQVKMFIEIVKEHEV